MNADEVYKLLDERQTRHEEKCNERQTKLYAKINHLERVVWIGIGLFVAVNALIEAGVVQSLFGR